MTDTTTRCTAFDYCGGIERAAEIITEGTALFTPAELAGHYAYQAAKEAGYGCDTANLDGHLDIAAEAGAVFDAAEALAVAEALASPFKGITVHSVQLSGNIGDGWTDENAAIDAFAEFLQSKLEAALPGADITVNTQHNTSGYESGPAVAGDDEALVQRAESIVEAVNQTAFDEFCNSDAAAEFIAA